LLSPGKEQHPQVRNPAGPAQGRRKRPPGAVKKAGGGTKTVINGNRKMNYGHTLMNTD
jgi:hypothetical protein